MIPMNLHSKQKKKAAVGFINKARVMILWFLFFHIVSGHNEESVMTFYTYIYIYICKQEEASEIIFEIIIKNN